MTWETAVIHRVLQGDTESFRLLVERYEKPVVRMVKNLTGDSHVGEDVAQDVFLTAYKKLTSFDPALSDFSTWLFTITRNKSLNALKKKRAFPRRELADVAGGSNPHDAAAAREFFEKLSKELHSLPARQRRAFVMAEFEKLSYQQIAQIEGVRLGTVKSRINRAKTKLRAALEDFGGDAV
jgi:RNA polymerase sigma-70 factor (ECF subfamily)